MCCKMRDLQSAGKLPEQIQEPLDWLWEFAPA